MKLLLTSFFLIFVAGNCIGSRRLVCYYGSWSVYRYGYGKFTVEDIDPHVCSHVIFSFVGLNPDGTVKILDPWNDVGDEWHEGAFTKLQKLKTQNPSLKLLLAIGGWNEGSEKYSKVANDPNLRSNLINSAVETVVSHGFDGFDLDWEYPTQRGGSPTDRQAFSQLLREFRQRFNSEGLLLSAAVSASPSVDDQAYDIPVLSETLDFINLMAYDIHGAWDPVTGHNTPLRAGSKDIQLYGSSINLEDTIKHWLNRGCDPLKLNLGLASYGRAFTLSSTSSYGVGAPSRGNGLPGKFVNEPGFLAYNEICYEQTQNLWKVYRDEEAKVPYAVKNDQWVGYDDPQSIAEKMKLALSYNLGGGMLWSIETDDFANICGQGTYPLLKAAIKVLGGLTPSNPSNPSTAPPATPPEIITIPPTTSAPATTTVSSNDSPSQVVCSSSGQLLADPSNCSKFFQCQQISANEYKAISFTCQPGLEFDSSINSCNYANLVEC